MHLAMSVSRVSMALQNYQKFIVLTSNMIYIVALGVGFKCPCKIHMNTQCPPPPLGFAGLAVQRLLFTPPKFLDIPPL